MRNCILRTFPGVLLFIYFISAAPAIAIEGLPGANWVSLNNDINGLTGSGGMGWLRQGIDWTTLPGDIKLNTYVEYGLRERSKEKEYFNARGPSIGLQLEKSYFTLGVDYYWVEYPELAEPDKSDEGHEYTFGWYYLKDLKPEASELAVVGFPFSTWGKLWHDASGLTGSGGMGWVQQGIDWFTLPGDVTVNTFVKYSYRGREKENDYFDAQGPSVGIEFKKSVFSAGYSYYWEEFPVLNEKQETEQFFAGWFYSWDLMK